VASVIRSLLSGVHAGCSHGRQIRDFLYIRDAAEAFVALLHSKVAGSVNIASGHAIALRELIDIVADKVGRRDLVQLGAIPAADGEPPVLLADTTRLRDEVGWSPRYDLARGL